MSEPNIDSPTPFSAPRSRLSADAAAPPSRRLFYFGAAALGLSVVFLAPLFEFLRFGIDKDRNTYLLLIPFISAYLIWIKRPEISRDFKTALAPALVPAVIAITALVLSFSVDRSSQRSLHILSYLAFLLALAFLFLGTRPLKQLAFPIGFLIFAIPIPAAMVNAIEIFLQYTSAEAAYGMLSLTPVPLLRDGLIFQMPNITPIIVAQECSGFNSTWVLFIVSILAGHLFLKSTVNRLILCLFVIPLAILRNGFRITVIGLLCVYIDPSMIDSFVHRQGGPLFFALSLIPFLWLLWFLRKWDARQGRPPGKI